MDENFDPMVDEYTEPIDYNKPVPPLKIFSPKEVLKFGLQLVYNEERITRVKALDAYSSKTNFQRFKDHYGANHFVVAAIWEDLQTTTIQEARIKALKLNHFFESLNFLYRYKTEAEREAQFDKSPKTLRKWAWYYIIKIQNLKGQKIIFPEPDEWDDDEEWIMTTDGVHSLFHEIAHHEFSQNRKYFSHKKKHAGLCYELGIHLFEPRLIWMNGSFPAGPNDKANYVTEGLHHTLLLMGKKCLGDKIYNGYDETCSTFNALDDDAVKEFKARAQMRHEKFNGMLKEFKCLFHMFRHDQAKFEVCFEACAVICQYRMEHGEPLWDVMAGVRFKENGEPVFDLTVEDIEKELEDAAEQYMDTEE